MEYFCNGIGSFKREDLRMGLLVIDILDESIKFSVNPDLYIVKQNFYPKDNEIKQVKLHTIYENRNVLANGRITLKI